VLIDFEPKVGRISGGSHYFCLQFG